MTKFRELIAPEVTDRIRQRTAELADGKAKLASAILKRNILLLNQKEIISSDQLTQLCDEAGSQAAEAYIYQRQAGEANDPRSIEVGYAALLSDGTGNLKNLTTTGTKVALALGMEDQLSIGEPYLVPLEDVDPRGSCPTVALIAPMGTFAHNIETHRLSFYGKSRGENGIFIEQGPKYETYNSYCLGIIGNSGELWLPPAHVQAEGVTGVDILQSWIGTSVQDRESQARNI